MRVDLLGHSRIVDEATLQVKKKGPFRLILVQSINSAHSRILSSTTMGVFGNVGSFSGIEVARSTEPEQIAPANVQLEDKFYNRSGVQEGKLVSNGQPRSLGRLSQRKRSELPICSYRAALWTLAVLTVVSFAAALGAVLGGGLAA